jgi:hypothetical protein
VLDGIGRSFTNGDLEVEELFFIEFTMITDEMYVVANASQVG